MDDLKKLKVKRTQSWVSKEEKMFLVGVGERGNMIKIRTKFSNNEHQIWEEELTV